MNSNPKNVPVEMAATTTTTDQNSDHVQDFSHLRHNCRQLVRRSADDGSIYIGVGPWGCYQGVVSVNSDDENGKPTSWLAETTTDVDECRLLKMPLAIGENGACSPVPALHTSEASAIAACVASLAHHIADKISKLEDVLVELADIDKVNAVKAAPFDPVIRQALGDVAVEVAK